MSTAGAMEVRLLQTDGKMGARLQQYLPYLLKNERGEEAIDYHWVDVPVVSEPPEK